MYRRRILQRYMSSDHWRTTQEVNHIREKKEDSKENRAMVRKKTKV